MDDDLETTECRASALAGRRRAGSLFSLIWLGFPLSGLVASDPSLTRLALNGIALAVFVTLYLRALWATRPTSARRIAPTVISLAAIASALTLADRSAWSLLFVLVATMAALTLPERVAPFPIAGCAVLAGASELYLGEAGNGAAVAATVVGIGILMIGFARLIRANEELQDAREDLARLAVAEERLRFARDLHDLLGHSLSVIALKAELAGRLLPGDADRAAGHISDVRDVARAALVEVRDAVSGYRLPTLAVELAGARAALEAAGIDPELEELEGTLPPDAEAVLAWAVREGTTNVIRHSGAARCRIAVRPGPAVASAEIVDDGRGGDPGAGHGLEGLRERVRGLAGELEVGPSPGGGFRLRVSVPIGPATA